MATKEKQQPTGVCTRCGKPLDDHNGWFSKKGPFCPVQVMGGRVYG